MPPSGERSEVGAYSSKTCLSAAAIAAENYRASHDEGKDKHVGADNNIRTAVPTLQSRAYGEEKIIPPHPRRPRQDGRRQRQSHNPPPRNGRGIRPPPP